MATTTQIQQPWAPIGAGTGSVLANNSHADTDGIHNVAILGDLA